MYYVYSTVEQKIITYVILVIPDPGGRIVNWLTHWGCCSLGHLTWNTKQIFSCPRNPARLSLLKLIIPMHRYCILYSRVHTTQAIYQLIHVNITILKKRTCVRVCVCVCEDIVPGRVRHPPHNIHANPHPPPGGAASLQILYCIP